MKKIIAAGLMIVLGGGLSVNNAIADSYPNKPVSIVSPFAVGGIADLFSRVLAQAFSDDLGQAFVVTNRTGAGGSVGSEYVARANPDGYTIVMGNIGSHAVNPFLVKNMRYDPIKDFEPISLVLDAEGLLVINPKIPANNLKEFIQYAKENSGKLTYGSGGIGTTSHLAGELFQERTGVELVHVPYKGNNPAITDLIGGQTDIMFATMPTVLPHVNSGRLKALAVLGNTRSTALPDVPALNEEVADFEVNNWIGLFAPAGTPKEIIVLLNEKTQEVMNRPDVKQRLESAGSRFVPSTPDSFRKYQLSESERWEKILKAAGVEPQ